MAQQTPRYTRAAPAAPNTSGAGRMRRPSISADLSYLEDPSNTNPESPPRNSGIPAKGKTKVRIRRPRSQGGTPLLYYLFHNLSSLPHLLPRLYSLQKVIMFHIYYVNS